MKNDLLLFAVMFAVAWIGFANLKGYLPPGQMPPAIEQTPTQSPPSSSQTPEETIRQVIGNQAEAWNQGDFDGFMQAYWKDETLTVTNGGETTTGWDAAYANYRQTFPQTEMGHIEFTDLNIEMVGDESAIVMGKRNHNLPKKNLKGTFSLVLKKFDNQWKIIHDHTSIAE